MSAGSFSQTPQVRQILESCRRQILQHTLLVGSATLLITVAVGLLAAGTLDYLLGLPAWFRALTLLGFVATIGFVVWQFLIRPLKSAIPLNQLGAAIDLTCPELNESLATLISIQRPEATSAESGSTLMQRRLQQQISEQLKGVASRQFVDGRSMTKRCGIAGICLLVLLLPLVLWPSGSRLLVARVLNPFANLATATNLYFEVADGNRTVAKGSTITISAAPKWRTTTEGVRPEVVNLQLMAPDGESENLTMAFDASSGNFQYDLTRIAESVQFRVTGGGATTETFSIKVVDAPEVKAAVMTVTPPAYTGKAITRFDGMVGDMQVFERSKIEILLEFNKPVDSAALVWIRRVARPVTDTELFDRQFDNMTGEEVVVDEEDVLNMNPNAPLKPEQEPLAARVDAVLSPDRLAAVFEMTADVGGDFVFEVLDEHQLGNPSEPDRTISVGYDKPPELKVSGIRNGDRLRPDDILPVNCLVKDDIGIGLLELHVSRNTDAVKITPAVNFDKGTSELSHSFRLSLPDLQLAEDDRLTVRIRTADERPEPGPQYVWSEEFIIVIDRDAEAVGAKAMEKETRQMVETLKQIEEQLRKDTEKAKHLEQRAENDWTDESREEAEALSEKEQQQGRLLEQLANEVATHPMMKESAEKLQQLSEDIRDKLPELLDEAVDSDRQQAKTSMFEAVEKMEQVRSELHQEIEKIEEIARLEQKLTELNRLALDAEQLAKDADQLESDRQQPDAKPEDVEQQQWDQELNQRQQELNQDREGLSEDLERLIQEERELLEAAQRAQKERLQEIADEANKLASREQKVADGVQDEAQEAGADARQIAEDLDKARQQAEQIAKQQSQNQNDDGENENESNKADVQALQQAAEQLRQGNLAEPRKQVDDVASQLAKDEKSAQVADQLKSISERIEQLQQERNAGAEQQQPQPADSAASQQKNDVDADQAVNDMLQRLKQLADAAKAAADATKADTGTNAEARDNAQQSAEKAEDASEEAAAGKFAEAADQLRKAAQAADKSAQQMQTSSPQQQDLPGQMEGVKDELNRAAEMLQNMQQDNRSQSAAQQQTQQDIAQQAAKLPEKLRELSEIMAMEALQMQKESQQAADAQQVAQQAQQSSQQASSDLQQAQLQQAGQSSKQAAEQLKRMAQMAEAAGQQAGEQDSPIPTEVGESVADALQDLQQAAKAMQQQPAESEQAGKQGDQAEQSANGEPGQPAEGDQAVAAEGQPGQQGESGQEGQQGQPSDEGQAQAGQSGEKPNQSSGSQQLNSAAKALAQAAQDALPGQFNPGQMPDSGEPSQAGRDAMGNAALWDGRIAAEAAKAAGSRDWGQQNDELETETSDAAGISRDSEYQALIRMYFREVARATANQDDN